MRFFLGTHKPEWLSRAGVDLFVSHRTLRLRKGLPRAIAPWALDSGAYSELDADGRWSTTVDEYVAAVRRYHDEVGMMEWAAPMDWMCEPHIVQKTGLTVEVHQARTVLSILELRTRAADLPFIPVLQGYSMDDYRRCVDLYGRSGIDLEDETVVGLGSVCRRQATPEIADLVRELGASIRLHGFGMKLGAFKTDVPKFLASADSLAWSYNARRRPPRAGCSHGKEGKGNCANCILWAMDWRDKAIALIAS